MKELFKRFCLFVIWVNRETIVQNAYRFNDIKLINILVE